MHWSVVSHPRSCQMPSFGGRHSGRFTRTREARPSSAAVATFLKAHGINHIYADSTHPNSLVTDAVPIENNQRRRGSRVCRDERAVLLGTGGLASGREMTYAPSDARSLPGAGRAPEELSSAFLDPIASDWPMTLPDVVILWMRPYDGREQCRDTPLGRVQRSRSATFYDRSWFARQLPGLSLGREPAGTARTPRSALSAITGRYEMILVEDSGGDASWPEIERLADWIRMSGVSP